MRLFAAWVYRVYDDTGRLIYIGSTSDVVARFANHQSSTWWACQIAEIRCTPYPSLDAARVAERLAISSELPRWNRQDKWEARAAWDHQDWLDYLEACRNAPDNPRTRLHIAIAARECQEIYPESEKAS